MSTKKKFSIAPDLAKGLRNTVQSATTNQGQLHYDMMSIHIIEPDPENPRKLTIDENDVRVGLKTSDPNYEIKKAELDSLKELADSIARVGVRNAIEVYKEEQRYRIISGERRFLACILNKEQSIPVRINQKPDEFKLRYMQWVENINRQDLSLKEKYINLTAMVNAYNERTNHKVQVNDKILQDLLGISNSHAYRFYCLLRADKKIIDLVNMGKLNNIKLVQELVSMKDKGAREQILSWILSSKSEVTSLADYKMIAGKKAMISKAIHLGKINDSALAKYLMDILLSHARFNKYQKQFSNINWSSPKSISQAFQTLLNTLESELSTEQA